MFGIGDVVGKIAGPLLDKIGLEKVTPFLEAGVDALTGNWGAAAKNAIVGISGFGDLGFLNKIAQFAPLGGFDAGNLLGEGGLSSVRLQDLLGAVAGEEGDLGFFKEALNLLSQTTQNNSDIGSLIKNFNFTQAV